MDMGRGEERVRCMERVTWKLTLPYAKWISNGNLLYDSELKQGLCNNLEGGVGREAQQRGDIHIPVADSY